MSMINTETRGDWKIREFKYLRTDPYWTLISKTSSKTLLSSANDASLLVVLRMSPVETIR